MAERSLYTELAWLPEPPNDFKVRCARLADHDDPALEIHRLAGHALDESKLSRLANVIAQLLPTGRALDLTPFRLGLIGSGTLELLVPSLIASAARHGLALQCVKGHYDQFLSDAISATSDVNLARCDAVLIALDYRSLPIDTPPGDAQQAKRGIAAGLDLVEAIRTGIRTNSGALSIVQTFPSPPETLLGSFDRLLHGSWRSSLDELNRLLAAGIQGTSDVLLDIASVAETVGLASWYSQSQWNMARLPFASEFVPLYSEHVARLLAALRGKSRRCLVLDLDNTLWGGVIGDDGLEGIRVAQGDAVGEAYLTVQRLALALRDRGVVLAVSSKNDDETARTPFRKHPEMLLREEHFAVFQANWNDKASNITAIADELSLGLESIVFLDDNPVERNLVRQALPQVAVPELPEDPALFARTLAAAGYFEAVTFSTEDRQRASLYEDNARRVALQKQAIDLDSYLVSLEMEITFQPFDKVGRARITQLINKSNQFNLTTRRYTEAEIRAVEQQTDCFTLQVRLADRFGDNGMISVIICRPARLESVSQPAWLIDTWLMSCRVLGRKVEEMVLREMLLHARAAGVGYLLGRYLPTERNSMVRDHYRKLGFSLLREIDDGGGEWLLSTQADVQEAPMVVRRVGFESLAERLEIATQS
jgi:FkbH-like protein